MILKYLIEKEFKQFLRNSFMPRIALVFPTIIILVFPWVATMDVSNINVSVVDRDVSTMSRRLSDKIAGSSYFNLTEYTDNYKQALDDVEEGKSDIIVEIPQHFERDLTTIQHATVQISSNGVNALKGSIGSGYLQNITADFNADLATKQGVTVSTPFSVNIQDRYNPTLNFKLFMIPALMTMIIIMLCGLLPALNIVSEKEIGTIEQINVTPVNKAAFILSKLIPYWLMGFIILTICFILAALVYGYTPKGSFLTIYAIAILFVLVMSGIGLIISNYAATMQQSLFMMFFFMMIFMLMSGLFTDVRSMPDWAQNIAFFNPPRYFIDTMRSVFLKGGNIADNIHNFMMLSVFAIVTNIWAMLSYRKQV